MRTLTDIAPLLISERGEFAVVSVLYFIALGNLRVGALTRLGQNTKTVGLAIDGEGNLLILSVLLVARAVATYH